MYEFRFKPLVIGICGMYRSGSTYQYNAVRLLLERAGHMVNGGGVEVFNSANRYDVLIVKEHKFRQIVHDRAHIIFTSDRKKEDVIASMERFRGYDITEEKYADWSVHLDLYKAHSSYHMEYDEILTQEGRIHLLRALAAAIDPYYSRESPLSSPTFPFTEVLYDLAALRPPLDDRYDKKPHPTTLLYRNHRTASIG